jgi:hypothetical protein
VRERSQREGVLVAILAFEQKFVDKVTAADLVRQIAELPVAERVVAKILNGRAAIGIGVRLRDLVLRKPGKVLSQKRLNLVGPEHVDSFLVSQHGVRGRSTAGHQHDEHNRSCTQNKQWPTMEADSGRY